jgi:Protein of unknown function (DUF4231)
MTQVTLDRLEDQITWYDARSGYCQRMYKGLKVAELVAAAGVPLVAGLAQNAWITGALGVVVVVLEGVQHLNQYHGNWMSYRSTAEALKHEKYLHAAKAGPYAVTEAPDALLAERVEGLISQEHAKWVTQREQKKPDARP